MRERGAPCRLQGTERTRAPPVRGARKGRQGCGRAASVREGPPTVGAQRDPGTVDPKPALLSRCCAVSGGRAPTGGSGTSGPRTVTLPGGRGTHVPALLLKTSCPPPCWQPLRATSAQQSLAVASWSWRPKCSHSRGSPDPRRHPWGSHGASVLALGALAPQLCGPGARAHAEACSGRVPWGAGGAIPHQGLPGRHATC